ncbi:MAG TPA: acylphosphatase [Actinomycetota bacterium]|nr:acylphosphatase [Actinomycetota bacterium]
MARRVHVIVGGEVQGVSFRWYCSKEASSRGVGGFIRNLRDGRVEAVFEGDPQSVDSMIEWCRHGPPGARVRDIEVTEEQPTGDRDFTIGR